MAKNNLLPRGFKARAEKIAIFYRNEFGLHPHEPLCGFKLANHLKIEVCRPIDIFSADTNIEDLVGTPDKDNGWSALTMITGQGNKLIIHNHLHAPSRQQSNLMHEIAHHLCKHVPVESIDDANLYSFMRGHNPQQEEEANYLGSVLQITREGLLWNLKQQKNYEEIAEYYSASVSMVNFRINSTGVMRQLNYHKF